MKDQQPTYPVYQPFQLGQPFTELPDWIGFSLPDRSNGVAVRAHPMLVLGYRNSLRDRDITVDLTPLNARQKRVSRFHAMVLTVNNQVVIKDMHSHTGTILNGRTLIPDREYPLNHMDRLMLGHLELLVYFVEESKA